MAVSQDKLKFGPEVHSELIERNVQTIKRFEDNNLIREFIVVYHAYTRIRHSPNFRTFPTYSLAEQYLKEFMSAQLDKYGGEFYLNDCENIPSVSGVYTNIESFSDCWIQEEEVTLIFEQQK